MEGATGDDASDRRETNGREVKDYERVVIV